jgi:hypothetical protein
VPRLTTTLRLCAALALAILALVACGMEVHALNQLHAAMASYESDMGN